MSTAITTMHLPSDAEPINHNQRMTILMREMNNIINFSKMSEIDKIKLRRHLKETQELWTKIIWQVMEKPMITYTDPISSERLDKLVATLPQIVKKKRGRPGKLKPLCAG